MEYWPFIVGVYLVGRMLVSIFGKHDLFEDGSLKNFKKLLEAIKTRDRIALLRCIPIISFTIFLLTMTMLILRTNILLGVSHDIYMIIFKSLILLGILLDSIYLYFGTKCGLTIGNTKFYIIFSKVFIFTMLLVLGEYLDSSVLEILKQSYKIIDDTLNLTALDDSTKAVVGLFNLLLEK